MLSDSVLKALNAVHHALVKVSGGRLGWTASKMMVVDLTTTGRKTGQPRSVMLTSPVQEDERLVVVASRAGSDHHPAWYLNLRDNPEVQVSMKGQSNVQMLARTASPEERARLWPEVTAVYQDYAEYQTQTEREIPLVILEPRE
jgi:deazaflavin-dependent oxidoreductase (nitroreductase family)